MLHDTVVDPHLELRGGGAVLTSLPAIFPLVISSFLPKIRGGPSPRSATVTEGT